LTSNYLHASIVEVWGFVSVRSKGCALMRGDPGSGGTVSDLAAQLGIADLEKFLRACIANAAMMAGEGDPVQGKPKIRYTVEEAADESIHGWCREWGVVTLPWLVWVARVGR